MTVNSPSRLDSNGYAPSILQEDCTRCFACGRRDRKLDRHEVLGGPFRQKSKKYGLWVCLCHDPCHLGRDGYQYDASKSYGLKAYAQAEAMKTYGWSTTEFIHMFGKNYLPERIDDDN